MAACAARAGIGSANAEKLPIANTGMTDIALDHWANKYIAWGIAENAINGNVDTKGVYTYVPDGDVTVIQVLKILEGLLNADKVTALTGDLWKTNTLSEAVKLGLLENITVEDYDAPATCEQVAQIILNAITMPGYTEYLGEVVLKSGATFRVDIDDGVGRSGNVGTRAVTGVMGNYSIGDKARVIPKLATSSSSASPGSISPTVVGITVEDASATAVTNLTAAWTDGATAAPAYKEYTITLPAKLDTGDVLTLAFTQTTVPGGVATTNTLDVTLYYDVVGQAAKTALLEDIYDLFTSGTQGTTNGLAGFTMFGARGRLVRAALEL